jgi:hypothetical protein
MSTTFGIEIEEDDKIVAKPVAHRSGSGNGKVKIKWYDPLYRYIRPDKDVIPMNNSAQGIHKIKDLLLEELRS